MANVEGRQPSFAALAGPVLRKKGIAIFGTNSAGFIDGLRPCVRHQSGKTVGVALSQLRTQRVVVTVSTVFNQNEQTEIRIGRAAGYCSWSGNGCTDTAVRFEMMTHRS